MFIHDNGRVCVWCSPRCGHTNMYHYFGITPYVEYPEIGSWIMSTNRVLVVRHPLGRFISAKNMFHPHFPPKDHYRPYMTELHHSSFRIIRFERLSEYIPRPTTKQQSIVTNAKIGGNGFDAMSMFYEHGKAKELVEFDEEVAAYYKILETKQEISPTEWKELTGE